MAALRLTIGSQRAISPPGIPDGERYLYGPPGVVRSVQEAHSISSAYALNHYLTCACKNDIGI